LTCYDTVLWYDITLTFLLINYGATSDFCMHVMDDTSYDTLIVSSLRACTINWRQPFFYRCHIKFLVIGEEKNRGREGCLSLAKRWSIMK
jgi:hypothetical protein